MVNQIKARLYLHLISSLLVIINHQINAQPIVTDAGILEPGKVRRSQSIIIDEQILRFVIYDLAFPLYTLSGTQLIPQWPLYAFRYHPVGLKPGASYEVRVSFPSSVCRRLVFQFYILISTTLAVQWNHLIACPIDHLNHLYTSFLQNPTEIKLWLEPHVNFSSSSTDKTIARGELKKRLSSRKLLHAEKVGWHVDAHGKIKQSSQQFENADVLLQVKRWAMSKYGPRGGHLKFAFDISRFHGNLWRVLY